MAWDAALLGHPDCHAATMLAVDETVVVPIPPGFTIRFKPGKELRSMTGLAESRAAKAADAGPPA